MLPINNVRHLSAHVKIKRGIYHVANCYSYGGVSGGVSRMSSRASVISPPFVGVVNKV